jgi:hypothetical protein
MLQIKIEVKKETSEDICIPADDLKSDSGGASFIIDTSDMSSQSDGGGGGSFYPTKGANVISSEEQADHYQKIKSHAVLCL